jgi:NADH-quinone oxidoreductase subunit N
MLSSESLFLITIAIGFIGALSPLILSYSYKEKSYFGVLTALSSAYLFVQIILLSMLVFKVINVGYSLILGGKILLDGFAAIPSVFIAFIALVVLLAYASMADDLERYSIFTSVLFLGELGSILISESSSISMFLSSWILIVISSYIAIASEKSKLSSDAALKYSLMGVVSTAFIVLWLGSGIYFGGDEIYGGVYPLTSKLAMIAIVMLTAGIGFKLGIFPFQWWMVDVYSFADGKSVSLITGVIKVGVIFAFTRMLYYTFYLSPSSVALLMISILSILTMTFGNFAAFTSKVFPRILAYSSIAQIGYIMVGMVGLLNGAITGNQTLVLFSSAAIAVQGLSYALSKSLSFLVSGRYGSMVELSQLKGLYRRDPVVAFSIIVAMLNLLGLPPLLGFWGKVYLFQAGVTYSIWLVVIAIINSGISSFYYGRIIAEIFSSSEQQGEDMKLKAMRTYVIVLAILLIVLGLGLIQAMFSYMGIHYL